MTPRSLLLLALVAMMLLGAAAAAEPAHGGKKKGGKKKCSKTFPGCKKCSGTGDDFTCDVCKDRNTIFDEVIEGECACDSTEGYGKFTTSEWKAYKDSQNGSERKSRKRSKSKAPKGCVLCEKYDDYEAVDGFCEVAPITKTTGRRLFVADEVVSA